MSLGRHWFVLFGSYELFLQQLSASIGCDFNAVACSFSSASAQHHSHYSVQEISLATAVLVCDAEPM